MKKKTDSENTVVKSEKVVEKKVGKFERLAGVLVRTSPEEAAYEPMRTEEGWYTGLGHPRMPENAVDATMLSILSAATKDKCAIFATTGGLRIMKDANAHQGVCFIERKHLISGKKLYLFTADEDALKKAGFVDIKIAKGAYVAPRNEKGELMLEKCYEFMNNHRPMGWNSHPWAGYEVKPEEKKVAKKKEKKEGKKDVPKEGGKVLFAAKEKETEEKPVEKKKLKKKNKEEVQAAAG